jgi:hypothetical protein
MSTALMQAVGRAIRACDQQELAKMAALDPSATLLYLDGHMRGLLPVPDAPGTQDWLLQVDRTLRAKLADDGVAERNADLTIMRAAYGQGSLFLVVGAGVSIPAKLPGWKDLVVRVLQLVLDFGSDAQRARFAASIREGPLRFAWGEVEEHVREALAGLVPLPPDARGEAESVLQELSTKSSYTSADLMRASAVAKKCFGDQFYDHLEGILYFSGPLETTGHTKRSLAWYVPRHSRIGRAHAPSQSLLTTSTI